MHEPLPPYVILHHIGHGPEHWDLMLDVGEVLATWQLLDDPHKIAPETVAPFPARKIGDHRRDYLDQQGPVSGDRGEVKRIDQGNFEFVERTDRCWIVRLDGELLKGTFRLKRQPRQPERWILQRLT